MPIGEPFRCGVSLMDGQSNGERSRVDLAFLLVFARFTVMDLFGMSISDKNACSVF